MLTSQVDNVMALGPSAAAALAIQGDGLLPDFLGVIIVIVVAAHADLKGCVKTR